MLRSGNDFVHPDDLEQVKVALSAALNDSGPTPFVEYRFRHKDGSWVWIQASGTNMLRDPALDGILFVAWDVTARKVLEVELRQHQALVENTLDMLAIINPDNTWRYVSPAFERVLGYRAEELVGNLSSDLMPPDDREYVMRSGTFDELAQMRGPSPPFEYRYRHKDGSYRYLAVVLNNLLDDPSITGVIGSVRDVTERVRAEAEIRHLNETLERRVRERTAQLEAVVSKLEAQGRMLQESEEMCRSILALAPSRTTASTFSPGLRSRTAPRPPQGPRNWASSISTAKDRDRLTFWTARSVCLVSLNETCPSRTAHRRASGLPESQEGGRERGIRPGRSRRPSASSSRRRIRTRPGVGRDHVQAGV